MRLRLRDLVTGQTADVDDDSTEWWWTEGNGSCDCNRACYFPDIEDELEAKMRHEHPELLPHQGICFGTKRIIVEWVHPDDLDGHDLADFNVGYPAEA